MWEFCSQQIETVREALKESGLSQRSIDHISHAQCALLDESVFTLATPEARKRWDSEPLQAHFFNRHQAGEFLYEEMREVLREPSPNPSVVTVYLRVMLLGFNGRYSDVEHPERLQLIAELEERVAPLQLDGFPVKRLLAGRPRNPVRWLISPIAHGVAACLLLVAVWLGLDRHLVGLIDSFPPLPV
ncbi:type VI secretion system protein TssL, short form [Pseudomonas sp. NPDC090202]|uniref:type VI secretion system protein TssL, short form n=1 Tax=Pseudomonas sp. NPDC090202 TaxID=3364476 RepID=UPI003825713A